MRALLLYDGDKPEKEKKGVSFCQYIGRIYLNATEKNPTPPLMITRFGRNYYSLSHSLAGSYTHACTHIIRNIYYMYTIIYLQSYHKRFRLKLQSISHICTAYAQFVCQIN